MSYRIITTDGELYHFGTKGMKWGVRKYQNEDGTLTDAGKKRYAVDSAKKDYKKSKEAFREANSDYRRAGSTAMGYRALNDYRKKEGARNAAELDVINKKAALAKAKKGDKGEINAYAKEMSKKGLAGSYGDKVSGGSSSRLYDHLASTRGEDFANAVSKKAQTKIITKAAVAMGAAMIGQVALNTYMAKKGY